VKATISTRKALAIVLTAIALTAIVTYVFAASSNIPLTIGGGLYPGATDYTIWREGNYYFAKNSSGAKKFSGTNASQVIISTIQANTRILLKAGTYTIDSTIVKAVDNVVIEGEGNGTIIKINGQINAFEIQGRKGWVIRNLQIDGNMVGNSYAGDWQKQNGIFAWDGAANLIFEKLYIHDTVQSGILIRNQTTGRAVIKSNFIWNCNGSGINIRYGHDIVIAENILWNNGGYPHHNIYAYADYNLLIQGNTIYGDGSKADSDGIQVYPAQNTTIIGNALRGISRVGIYVQYSSSIGYGKTVIIQGNIICNTGLSVTIDTMLWKNGIRVITESAVVTDNIVWGCPDNGIYVATHADYSVVSNNVVRNCSTGIKIYDADYITITGNNVLYNSGDGINAAYSNYTVITSNVASGNNKGIVLDHSYYCLVSGNEASGNSNYGIIEWSTTDYNIITSCSAFNNPTVNIKTIGSNTQVHLCYNGTSWIS